MAKIDAFNAFLMERFSGIAGEIFQFVQAIVLEQQDEIKRTKEENRNLKIMLTEASVNKGNSRTDAQTIRQEGPAIRRQNNYEPLDSSLMRVKLELSTLQADADPEPLMEAPTRATPSACVGPSPKKTDVEKLAQGLPTKMKERGLQMNSYLTINLVPCDAQLIPDNLNSKAVRIEGTSGGCEKGAKEGGLHSCPYCKELFNESSLLMAHLESHGGPPFPLYCQICGKHFKNRATLKNHLIVHQKLRRFRCNVCGKGFHQNGHLKEHQRIHTGEKPYGCSVCGKRFTQFNHVRVHVRNHHQDTIQLLEKTKRKR